MNIEPYLGPPQSLLNWLEVCGKERGKGYWLIFKDSGDNQEITLQTEMYPITGDTGEMSDDEYEEFDASINKSGFSNFLNLDQLEDILDNLTMQKKNYTDGELMEAVDHYFERDTFITVKS